MSFSKTSLSGDQLKVFEQTRILLVKRAGLMFIAILAVIAIINSLHKHYNPTPDITTIVLISFCLILLRKTGNYRLVTKIGVTGATFTLVTILFTMRGMHLTTPIWMVTCIVFTYLVLEKLWGAIITALNFGGLSVYIMTIFEERMNSRFLIQKFDAFIFMTEFVVQAAALGYVLHVFLNASQATERYLVESHRHAEEQNAVISKQKSQIEVMLKEIHHRVKNNLQIISSLLRLQSGAVGEKENTVLIESVNRVNTMAMIHEKMYKSDTFQDFDLSNYVENLVMCICDSYPVGKDIKARVEVDDFVVSTETMVPLAMIINELITNSIKHAFVKQPDPRIELRISGFADNEFGLLYRDNGQWKESESAFGSEIIGAMTEQLDGSQVIDKHPDGTVFTFQFAKNK